MLVVIVIWFRHISDNLESKKCNDFQSRRIQFFSVYLHYFAGHMICCIGVIRLDLWVS